jgi:membrane protein required for colicin V production
VNWLDYLLLALLGLSCIMGLFRGLLREVISLLAWVGALWLSWRLGPLLAPQLAGMIANEAIRVWVARTVIFLLVLLLGAVIGALLSRLVRASVFSGADRLLGAVFGLLRGVVMVALVVILCQALRLQAQPWWRESILLPYGERAANVLRDMVGERKIHPEHPRGPRGSKVVASACAASSASSVPLRSISACMTR